MQFDFEFSSCTLEDKERDRVELVSRMYSCFVVFLVDYRFYDDGDYDDKWLN